MIRALTPADVDAFVKLRYEAFTSDPLSWDHEPGTPIDPQEWAPRLAEDPGKKFVLGFFLTNNPDNPQLAGIIGFLRYAKTKRRHRAMLWGVYVSPAARGRGAAAQLLDETIRQARQFDGLERLTLTVSNHATAAIHLYQKAGFTEFGREPGAARTGETAMDEIYMLLDL